MRPTNFMEWAREKVQETPGLTALEIGQCFHAKYPHYSQAKNPARSLGNSLAKSVREGQEPKIEARGDPLQYYPTEG